MDLSYYVAQSEVCWGQVDSSSSLLAPCEIFSSDFVVVVLVARLVLTSHDWMDQCHQNVTGGDRRLGVFVLVLFFQSVLGSR